ncbi:glycosyltransferase family 2 protein [Halalkalibacter akibai]|uniref:Glycosyltransferase n=1 Tax=Halalkalibacter akibai (strain ATCC 43226 / DSM 21942 / CIP 109018 / JCM 9157 / 1139) TaxID=1236973 RepID=W4QN11_HALA3|nr:glycosyltransferase family 2 protein [Halalkalibacter akibai]GAE33038.1 glycosyltransferase [Halalkalibacter akibai JCM 9157]
MIVKNEEQNLSKCLDSIHDIVNEIVIVDTGSTDNTKKIAKKYGAKIFDFTWNNNFADARNFSLDQSQSKWNLVLDADEYIEKINLVEFNNFLKNEIAIGKIQINSKFLQEGEERFSRNYVSRLFPRDIRYEGRIHEQLISELPRRELEITVNHTGYFLNNKASRNIPLLIKELGESPNDPYYLFQLGKEYQINKDFNLSKKYLDICYQVLKGNEQFYQSAVICYLHTLKYLEEFNRAFLILNENIERLDKRSDFHFIKALLLMDLIFKDTKTYSHLLTEIESCYLRCIEIGENNSDDIVSGTGNFMAFYNLGVYYETTNQFTKALEFYKLSANYKYMPAIKRLEKIK